MKIRILVTVIFLVSAHAIVLAQANGTAANDRDLNHVTTFGVSLQLPKRKRGARIRRLMPPSRPSGRRSVL